jgi:hypothetical protein
VPHVTVGIGLSPAEVGRAVSLAREAPVFHPGILTRIAVAEFPPMRALYMFPLSDEAAAG